MRVYRRRSGKAVRIDIAAQAQDAGAAARIRASGNIDVDSPKGSELGTIARRDEGNA